MKILSILLLCFLLQIKNAHSYELIKLGLSFVDENKETSLLKIEYPSKEEAASYLLHFENGKILDSNDELFDTASLPNGVSYFVMDKEGKIYSSYYMKRLEFEHSVYVSGEDVACAGTLYVKKGLLINITDISAQYPAKKPIYLDQVISKLKENNVDMSKVKVFYDSNIFP